MFDFERHDSSDQSRSTGIEKSDIETDFSDAMSCARQAWKEVKAATQALTAGGLLSNLDLFESPTVGKANRAESLSEAHLSGVGDALARLAAMKPDRSEQMSKKLDEIGRPLEGRDVKVTAKSLDKNGDVTSVVYPNGKGYKVSYERTGEPTEIIGTRIPGGQPSTWKRQDNGTWVEHDSKGNKTGVEMEKIIVSKEGDISFSHKSGRTVTHVHDGSTENISEYREVTRHNENGLPVTVHCRADARQYYIQYDANNKPAKIERDDGITIAKEPGWEWSAYRVGQWIGGNVGVDVGRDGTIKMRDRDGVEYVIRRDGSCKRLKAPFGGQ